jgi:hypothetical protein
MFITIDTAFYPDGFEVTGFLEVEATVTDASFSYSYGSINAVQQATDSDVEFLSFIPHDIAADLRRQKDCIHAPSRKRNRKARRQLARRLLRKLGWLAFNEWINDGGEREVWRHYERNAEI